uniref:Multifunctional fusion protein n=1 Tax=Streptomyces sp. R1128 TaxID=140437 RepID=Q9F6D6_9ACTN|nr:acetyl carboxylase [Streptomyces sp. R1128]
MTETAIRPTTGVADWVQCGNCRAAVYGKRWARGLRVCPECAKHHPVGARERLDQLLDPGSAEPIRNDVRTFDVLGFTDTKPYPARLAAARAATGLDEAVVIVTGRIHGQPLVVAAMDFAFLGGSLGGAVGELITLAAETALAEHLPLLIVSASGGARMQEGAVALMQMAKTSAALGQLDEAGVLTISLVTDPTYGGVAASFATLCDVIVAEPGARLGFAGRRVIAQTIREELPPEFQTAEYLLEHGLIDLIVPRRALRDELARLLRAGAKRPKGGDGEPARRGGLDAGASPYVVDPADLAAHDPSRQVRAARAIDRPTTLDYIALLCEDFVELRGDRISGDCPAIVAGLARFGGRPVAVIGHQKGHDAQELRRRNFGMPIPSGYRKAARIMRLADKLGLPVVTFVDTPGAYPGAVAEEQGQAVAIAENLRLMAGLRVPVVTVVTGEGGSGGALALAVANRVLMFENGIYSVISPEGCAAILWQDPAAAGRAARALRVTARELLGLGIVDGVLPEPEGGTGADPLRAADALRDAIAAGLAELSPLDGHQLVADRWARFRRYGAERTTDAEITAMKGDPT